MKILAGPNDGEPSRPPSATDSAAVRARPEPFMENLRRGDYGKSRPSQVAAIVSGPVLESGTASGTDASAHSGSSSESQ